MLLGSTSTSIQQIKTYLLAGVCDTVMEVFCLVSPGRLFYPTVLALVKLWNPCFGSYEKILKAVSKFLIDDCKAMESTLMRLSKQ